MLSLSSQPLHRTAEPGEPAPEIVLIADDLTGALDSGAQFAGCGYSTRLLLRGHDAPERVWAFSLETRNASGEAADGALRQRMSSLPASSRADALFFLKIDSAGRGPIAASILATADALRPDAVVIAPAFPAHGRTVRDGVLHIRDIAGQDATVCLASLFPDGERQRIATLPARHLHGAMRDALRQGRDLWLLDGASPADLAYVVDAATSRPQRILWAGSAGLAAALAQSVPGLPTLEKPRSKGCPVLLISGTSHPVTQLQLQSLRSKSHCTIFELTHGPTAATEIRAAFALHRPGALILTGGDTAALVLDALQAESILVGGEVAPGIPWGRIDGGLADACTVATKSGGFGDEAALLAAFDFCTGVSA